MELLLLRELFRSLEEFMQSTSVGVEGRFGGDFLMGGRVFELSSSTNLDLISLSSCWRLRGFENADAEFVAMVAIAVVVVLGIYCRRSSALENMGRFCNRFLALIKNNTAKLALNTRDC